MRAAARQPALPGGRLRQRASPYPTTLAACASHPSPHVPADRVERGTGMHGGSALKPVGRPLRGGSRCCLAEHTGAQVAHGARSTQLLRASEGNGRYVARGVVCGRREVGSGRASGDIVGLHHYKRFRPPLAAWRTHARESDWPRSGRTQYDTGLPTT